jgi:hypothetical protein
MVPHVRESAMRADGTSSVWNASAGKRLGPRHGREAILEAVAQSTAIGISAEARGLLTVMLRERITFTPIASRVKVHDPDALFKEFAARGVLREMSASTMPTGVRGSSAFASPMAMA